MVDSKVSALAAKTVLTGAEEMYINDAGISKKATVTNVLGAIPARFVIVSQSSDFLTTSENLYISPAGGTWAGAGTPRRWYAPYNITIKAIYVHVRSNGSNNDTIYTFQEAGPITIKAFTYGASATGAQSDEALNYDLDIGDYIEINGNNTGTGNIYLHGTVLEYEKR